LGTVEDQFADVDGIVNQSGVESFEVAATKTVVIGAVVAVSAAVAMGLPTIQLSSDNETALGVVVGLGEGASGAAGRKVSVALNGSGIVTKCVTKGAVVAGTLCKTEGSETGCVIAMAGGTTDVDEYQHEVGIALQTSDDDGDEILVVLG